MEGKRKTFLLTVLLVLLLVPAISFGTKGSLKKITAYDNGRRIAFTTSADTVAEALEEEGIKISSSDDVFPKASATLNKSTIILIQRKSKKLFSSKFSTKKDSPIGQIKLTEQISPIKFKTITKNDNLLSRGRKRVMSNGKDGKISYKYKIYLINGQEIKRELVDQKIINQPQNMIIANGTGGQVMASRGKSANFVPIKGSRSLTVVATAYWSMVSGTGRTATGRKAGYGVVAVDPRVIKLGTALYIPGYGRAIAADTGGAIKGSRIDLCFNTHAQALRFGRRKLTIQILN